MQFRPKAGAIALLVIMCAAGEDAQAASLSAAPLPAVVSGETVLARTESLGVPFDLATGTSFWAGNALYWNQPGAVSVQVSLTDAPSLADNAFVFFTVGNIEAGAWSGFQVDLSGSAEFITTDPIGSSRPATLSTATEHQLIFSDMDWQAGDNETPSSSNLSFNLTLDPTGPNESIVLSFKPIAVPEPTSGLLLAASLLAITRRRR